jgi:hypothetical protein
MGVTGDRAEAAATAATPGADGGLMGERLVGDATVNEERLRESDDVVRCRGSLDARSACCCCEACACAWVWKKA